MNSNCRGASPSSERYIRHLEQWRKTYKRTVYPFELLLHGTCHVNAFLLDGLDGEDATFVDANGAVDGRISEVRVRIRVETNLRSPQKWMQTLLCRHGCRLFGEKQVDPHRSAPKCQQRTQLIRFCGTIKKGKSGSPEELFQVLRRSANRVFGCLCSRFSREASPAPARSASCGK